MCGGGGGRDVCRLGRRRAAGEHGAPLHRRVNRHPGRQGKRRMHARPCARERVSVCARARALARVHIIAAARTAGCELAHASKAPDSVIGRRRVAAARVGKQRMRAGIIAAIARPRVCGHLRLCVRAGLLRRAGSNVMQPRARAPLTSHRRGSPLGSGQIAERSATRKQRG